MVINDRIIQKELRRALETVVEREFKRSLDRDRRGQTWTRLTDIEGEAQLSSDRDIHRQTWTRLTDIEGEAQLSSHRDIHRMNL